MNYTRSVKYIFENKKWWVIVLIGLLAMIVPIVGMIVFIGYLANMIIEFHKTKQDTIIDFDFNRLGDYLKCGIWPFLGALIPVLVVMVVFGALFFGMIALTVSSDSAGPIAIFIPLISLLYIPAIILMNFIIVPAMIGGAFGQSLGAALNKDFLIDFIKKMWAEILISLLFLWAVSMAATLIGLLLCCIGVYAAAPFMIIVQWHLNWQLYEEYLRRGGMAVN